MHWGVLRRVGSDGQLYNVDQLVGNISQQYGGKGEHRQAAASVTMRRVRVSASLDYALRAMVELAAAATGHAGEGRRDRRPPGDSVAISGPAAGRTSPRRAGRTAAGGMPAATGSRCQPVDITVADIARVIDGPLADVHGMSPEMFGPPGVAAPTKELWIAVRAALRSVMEQVTIADLAAGNLPPTRCGVARRSRRLDPSAGPAAAAHALRRLDRAARR